VRCRLLTCAVKDSVSSTVWIDEANEPAMRANDGHRPRPAVSVVQAGHGGEMGGRIKVRRVTVRVRRDATAKESEDGGDD
jgi:hypothetical protein